MNAMGTKVRVVEGLNEILPIEDPELGAELRKNLTKQGIEFHLGEFVKSVENTGNSTTVTLNNGTTFESDLTLVSLGITPNADQLNLDALGVRLSRGFH